MGVRKSLENLNIPNTIFQGVELIYVYIGDQIIITMGNWSNDIEKLELMQKIKENEHNCEIKKSFSGNTKMENLSFWITHKGIRPLNKPLDTIIKITSPKKKWEVGTFIGLLKYYQEM